MGLIRPGVSNLSHLRSKIRASLGRGDASLTLHLSFLLASGSAISAVTKKGPILTYSRGDTVGTNFNENGLLVTATTDEPRFDHNPVTNAALGLLIEGARTNLCLQSEDFSTTWTTSDTTIDTNTVVAPDGATTGDTHTHIDSTAFVRQVITIVADKTHTVSTFAKKKDGQWIMLQWMTGDFSSGIRAWFDVNNGVTGVSETTGTGTLTGSTMTDVEGGWYRLSLTGKIDASTTNGNIFTGNTDGDGSQTKETNGNYYWGAQLEEADDLSSYVATTTAQVTRAADVDSANISSQLGGTANTLVIAARTGYGAGVVVQIDDGTENERYRVERNASNEIHVIVTDGGVGQADLNLGSVADLTDFKVAVRLAANDFAASLDGAAVVTDTSGTLPTVDTIRIGMDTSGDEWNATIAEGKLFNVGKLDAFLQSEAA